MVAVMKKELKSYFYSPIGYIFIGLFMLMTSIFFYLNIIVNASLNFEYMFYSLASVITFIIPLLTMRMFSEESKNGTYQLLVTSPKSLFSIVMGKLLSAIVVLLITEVLSLLYFIILMFFGAPDIKVALTTLLGFLLLGMGYISFGMFASSITENQIVAGVITISFFISMWFLPQLNSAFSAFSLIGMFDKFPAGFIPLDYLITFITFTLLFIALTLIMLQRKKAQ